MKVPSICFDRYKMPDFSIATTDVSLTEDMSRYRFYTKDKRYFSYKEVVFLVDFLNSGCPIADTYDIPTDEECEQIIAKFACKDGNCHSFHLASALGLGFYGSIGIITTLEQYNKSPQDFIHSQALGYGVTGNYWCKGTGIHKGKASVLCLNSSGEPTIIRDIIDGGSNIGCSVRLIARPY